MVIGKIISIEYSRLKVRISTEVKGNSVNLHGEIYYFGNIGGYLKTTNALGETIVCEVTEISDISDTNNQSSFNVESNRQLTLKPIGTLIKNSAADKTDERKFSLGVGIYPTLYSDVQILTIADMDDIMNDINHPSIDEHVHNTFNLGISKNLINYPINLSINPFFNIHSAIIGNSGSGKSNTVTHILQQILEKKNYSAIGSKIILFDANGEYQSAFNKTWEQKTKRINIRFLKPNIDNNQQGIYESFKLPYYLLSLEEWCDFLAATEATQKPYWDNVLQEVIRISRLISYTPDPTRELAIYFAKKTSNIARNILERNASDTDKVTSIRSMVFNLRSIFSKPSFPLNNIEAKEFSEEKIEFDFILDGKKQDAISEDGTLAGIFEAFTKSDKAHYGDNQGNLQKVINKIEKLLQGSPSCISDLYERQEIGSWFSQNYLKAAAELCLIEEDSLGNKNMRNWTSTLLLRLNYFLDDNECKFMRGAINKPEHQNNHNKSSKDNISKEYLKGTFGIGSKDENSPQLVIVDVSELPSDGLEILTNATSRLIFDHRRKPPSKRIENPIHLILDEAHRYIKKGQKYLLSENVFEKIAREGRKFSCFLLISSQRPSELSETVLSQCGNYIVHRIQNDQDMRYVQAIMPFFSEDLRDKIKNCVPGEAVTFGNCVPMPLQVQINQADPQPKSQNSNISQEWFQKTEDTPPKS